MSNKVNIQMKQFNGIDYDNIYPDAKNGMAGEIIVTPNATFTSVKAIAPSGFIYNGEYIGGKWIIEVGEYGEYTINGEGNSPDSKSLTIDTCKQYNISLGPILLNDYTWSEISEASTNGTASSLWAVGDAKEVIMELDLENNSNYTTWVYILGFNHNAGIEGNNKIHFGCFRSGQNYSASNSIALDDEKYNNEVNNSNYLCMNTTSTNMGGWDSSVMRNDILGSVAESPLTASSSTILSKFPTELKEVMKQCNKYSDNIGNGESEETNVSVTTDWIWLLSEFEVHGQQYYANSYEQNRQKQYDYYKNGNSKIKNGFKNSQVGWWTRSLKLPGRTSFCYIFNNDSGYFSKLANYSLGVAPGFCV